MAVKKGSGAIDLLAYAAMWVMIRYIQLTPRWAGTFLMQALLACTYLVVGSRRRLTAENLKLIYPDADDKKLAAIVFNIYMKIGEMCAEYPRMAFLTPENIDSHMRFEGLERLKEAYERGKGVIVPTAHYGNFELMYAAMAFKGLPIYYVLRPLDLRLVFGLINNIREKAGVKYIDRERGLGEIFKRLRQGAVVGMAVDQNAAFNGIFVKFLGRWASTVKAPAVVHLRTGAPIIPVYAVREKDGTHTLHVLPEIKIKPTGSIKHDVFLITQRIADVQGEFVKRRPELWHWLHRRWKRKPKEKDMAAIKRFMNTAGRE